MGAGQHTLGGRSIGPYSPCNCCRNDSMEGCRLQVEGMLAVCAPSHPYRGAALGLVGDADLLQHFAHHLQISLALAPAQDQDLRRGLDAASCLSGPGMCACSTNF
jgi:hypothetical protein